MAKTEHFYISTPIYYVNAKPHLGHCYTTVIADVAARFQRLLRGGSMAKGGHGSVFFLTGTDEHADKVVTAGAAKGVTPQAWCDIHAAEFEKAFAALDCSHDDFIRTTQDRHKSRVAEYIRRLQQSRDIYLGDYTGWYDPGQEEYVTETAAKEHNYLSPVSGQPLVKRTERNYFFRLSAYQDRLIEHMQRNPESVLPEARRNEVLGRLRQPLQDIPVSRAVGDDPASRWGILMPDDPGHRIYVWIDALFNYLSAMDTPERRAFWPAQVHLIAKDILWFHAVIWPAMLMALGEALPRVLYAHSWWVMGERKMSKSLGNFVSIEDLAAYAERYGVDAVRWFLATQGPLGATDSEWSYSKFVEVYNADLANGIGNSTSRVGNMIAKYFDGVLPECASSGPDRPLAGACAQAVTASMASLDRFEIDEACRGGIRMVTAVDGYINQTEPFRLAKRIGEPGVREQLAAILTDCAEALRIASVLMAPAMPTKMAELWRNWNCAPKSGETLADLCTWGGMRPGTKIIKGDPLFMRADPALPEPGAVDS
ncbi:MAG: methionine--tRNA ligase [Phycisphaeraceae bacterium]|nr:methionine--tRNA ligase [Phycisphaeraceae bacterium]